jgi:dipeptidyl aminopeptidase/acylaminoacyl peptidase
MLAGRGVVDPTRVGLIGFSRGGYSTYYAITHPGRIKLAAAIVFDSITASYGEYVNEAAILGDMGTADYEKQYGTGTFWQNKAGWMDAPSFNIDRVATPVLFSTTGVTTKWAMLETVGAFRYARRPFDYLYYSAGSHQLQRPREREASMQATVDWMNFWLQGRESESVLDTDRLARWRKIREDWIKTQSEDAAAASR